MSKKYDTEDSPYLPVFERTVMEKLTPKKFTADELEKRITHPEPLPGIDYEQKEKVNLLNQYRAVQPPKHSPSLPKWVISLQKLFIQLLKHAGFKEENPSDRKY